MPRRRRVLVSRLADSRLIVSSGRSAWSPVAGFDGAHQRFGLSYLSLVAVSRVSAIRRKKV